ncbi:MAG TPA: glycosyltransferase [Chlamydiales bacterium]|nr:glycosyltransferase [Chlamydiales bacterium]
MEVKTPLIFSLAILIRKGRHLLPLTLETLKNQSNHNFEILLLDGEGSGRLPELAKQYPELKIRVQDMKGKKIGEMMNEGIRLARAQYVQFLEPGDRYISQYGLSHVAKLIEENHHPHLVYSAYLWQSPDQPPQAVSYPLNAERLLKGTIFRFSWFSKEMLTKLGGFDIHFSHRPAFELLCRLFLDREIRAIHTRRIFTDSEPQRTLAADVMGFANDTFRILYRHFGFWPALKWIFIQDHFPVLRWAAAFLKHAFWKR